MNPGEPQIINGAPSGSNYENLNYHYQNESE